MKFIAALFLVALSCPTVYVVALQRVVTEVQHSGRMVQVYQSPFNHLLFDNEGVWLNVTFTNAANCSIALATTCNGQQHNRFSVYLNNERLINRNVDTALFPQCGVAALTNLVFALNASDTYTVSVQKITEPNWNAGHANISNVITFYGFELYNPHF